MLKCFTSHTIGEPGNALPFLKMNTFALKQVIPKVILQSMKTAISINDEVFEKAEKTAQQLGLSRSKLYSMAVLEFVQNHDPEAITAKLNQVYNNNSSKLDDDMLRANYDLFSKDVW